MQIPFDLDTEELKNYKGINPKPFDFDAYWQKAITEINSIKNNIKIIKSTFESKIADCYDLYYSSTKGARIHSKMLLPKDKKKLPCIIKFHGLNCDSGEWTSLIPFVSEGYCVFSMDCRGQAGTSDDCVLSNDNTLSGFLCRGINDALKGNFNNLYYKDVILDSYKLYQIVINFEYIDKERIAVTGWSQGGALAIALAALVPSIKCLAPVHPYLSDYKRVWQLGLSTKAYEGINQYFRQRDPHHKTENEFFNALGYIDIKNMADKIKANVFFSCGLKDTTCPPSTQYAVYNRIKSTKYMNLFYDFDHENLTNLNDEIFSFIKNNL